MSIYYYDDDLIEETTEHTLLIYCENVPGVTSHISNLFSRIGVNITSLIGASSEDHHVYRVIIKCLATANELEKIVKHVNKLINIIDVKASLTTAFIEYEMSLIRMNCTKENYAEILKISDHFQGKIISYQQDKIVLTFSETPEKLDTIIRLLGHVGELEIVNSGVAVMEKEVSQTFAG